MPERRDILEQKLQEWIRRDPLGYAYLLDFYRRGARVCWLDEEGVALKSDKYDICYVGGRVPLDVPELGASLLLLTDDENIHQINKDMRDVDRATDVLSFPEFDLQPGELPSEEDADPGTGLVPLGDMVISMEHVTAQAKEYGHSVKREVGYLTIHSMLHLLV